jgi:hypothetical protein
MPGLIILDGGWSKRLLSATADTGMSASAVLGDIPE